MNVDKHARSIKFWILMIVSFQMSGFVICQELCFISGEQGWHTSGDPFPLEIFKYDTANNKLVSMWQYLGREDVYNIDVFPNDDIILISTGHNAFISSIAYIRSGNISSPLIIKLEDNAKRFNIITSDNNPLLYIDYGFDAKSSSRETKVYSLTDGKQIFNKTLSIEDDIMVANVPSMSGAGNVSLIKDDEQFIMSKFSMPLNVPSIPDDLITSDTARGWNLIANEEDFLAISVLAVSEKDEFREYLVYNKYDRYWKSYLVKGVETKLRPMNNYLVGIVTKANEKTDYSLFKGFAPVLTNETIILDPLKGQLTVVQFTDVSEILWIDDGQVYYRIADSLYRGRLQDGDIIDRLKLLTNEKIKNIHWAFPIAE